MVRFELNTLLALVAWLGIVACIYVWGRMMFVPSKTGLLRYFTVAFLGLLVAVAFSIGFWDVYSSFYSYNEWRSHVASLGGQNAINSIRNVILIIASYAGLKAAHLLIPEEDQGKWPWYLSWLTYPPIDVSDRFREFLRGKLKRDEG